MIKKLKYTFDKIIDSSIWYTVPTINILNLKEFPSNCLFDLCFLLPFKNIKVIIQELENVKNWIIDKSTFGFETTAVWVYQKWKWYYWEKYPDSEVTITFNYADDYIVTDLKIEDILKMMRDWRDYIEGWEKETGKVYKGI